MAGPWGVEILAVVLVVAIAARGWLGRSVTSPRAQEWVTVFVAIVVQAMPFVVLGTLLSAAIATLVPERFFARALPKRPALAVPLAGAAGLALPGCECASVPVAGALMRRGVTPAAALAFLLSAPAINPVVLAATAVAFPGRPQMVVGRLVASLATSVAMGWLWLRLGRDDWLRAPRRTAVTGNRAVAYLGAVRQDAAEAAGFLVIGAAAAATLNVLVPPRWLHLLAAHPVISVVALAGLAVLLSICSEADAFVAASLAQFSLTARLAFLVVGPMVDLKLFAMQAGTFGRGFATRFAPATFVVGVALAVAVGSLLW
ncbi:permease [Planosporangium thailandense]|uniref:Permease n=1 Tax=Planosporangium thailandense TaxID=765197 RepID=A0ABX0XUB1_9ACTN|nr:permease [Planosporangium thailandense]NJC69584.1 permease [Planosporangium thailandense]